MSSFLDGSCFNFVNVLTVRDLTLNLLLVKVAPSLKGKSISIEPSSLKCIELWTLFKNCTSSLDNSNSSSFRDEAKTFFNNSVW